MKKTLIFRQERSVIFLKSEGCECEDEVKTRANLDLAHILALLGLLGLLGKP